MIRISHLEQYRVLDAEALVQAQLDAPNSVFIADIPYRTRHVRAVLVQDGNGYSELSLTTRTRSGYRTVNARETTHVMHIMNINVIEQLKLLPGTKARCWSVVQAGRV